MSEIASYMNYTATVIFLFDFKPFSYFIAVLPSVGGEIPGTNNVTSANSQLFNNSMPVGNSSSTTAMNSSMTLPLEDSGTAVINGSAPSAILNSGDKLQMELESAPKGLILTVKEPGESNLIVG